MTLAASRIFAGFNATRDNVLRDVSCEMQAGRVTVIAGPNGAGKSTLLRVLLGVLEPGAGTVMMDGGQLTRWNSRERARRLAYVPQRASVAFAFSAVDVVAFGAMDVAQERAREAAIEALVKVGLRERAQDAFAALSVGQQQRAVLARAMVQLRATGAQAGTRVLLADEPMSAQDPASALRMCDLLRALAHEQGLAVVCVMHDLTLARRIADDVLLMTCDGHVAGAGPAEAVLTEAHLGEVFGVRFVLGSVECGGASVPTIVPVGPAGLPRGTD
jgi:iron complex transport system ATP-binding protein